MTEFTVKLDYDYVELIGEEFTDSYGNVPTNSSAGEYVSQIYQDVFETPVIDEFHTGWRDYVDVTFDEKMLDQFSAECSEMYLSDELDVEDFRSLIHPLQMQTVHEYWSDHIDALENSGIRYRKLQAECLSPLIEACDNVFTVTEILGFLLEGVVDNIRPLDHTDNRPSNVVGVLQDRIVDKEDEIDLSQGYFYQGPRHLGIISSGKEKRIAKSVCECVNGYLFPFLISNEDPVSRHTKHAVQSMMKSGRGMH